MQWQTALTVSTSDYPVYLVLPILRQYYLTFFTFFTFTGTHFYNIHEWECIIYPTQNLRVTSIRIERSWEINSMF